MWMQAQNPVLTGAIDWGMPLGALLAVAMLLVTALGVLAQGGAFAALLDWVMGDGERAARIATTAHRGHA